MSKHYQHNKKYLGDKRLRIINRFLFVLILIINGYVLLAPLWPSVSYRVQAAVTKPLAETDFGNLDRNTNHLVIPRLRLDKPIFDDPDPAALDKGIWRRPHTSTPDNGSNTVLSGHRWLYDNPSSAVFYNLDKIQQGDKLVAVWNEKIYIYTVDDIKIVPPTAVEVEDPTTESRLTVYTCTPLWTATDRLVISAKLEKTL